ncbi:MAG: butyrate kinase [Maledivibacter sp.]|jgi:butyrate kinase|nr:butyrate kinase [Maledivibacter sp.]
MSRQYILVINPGSTSTKVAIFKDTENVLQKNLNHSTQELDKYETIADQFEYRRNIILDWLKEEGYETSQLKAVVGRGGLLKPMPSGTYKVTDFMIEDLRVGVQGEHASNLGGIIAKSIGDIEGIESYIVDPVAVDEFNDIARISGIPHLKRRSLLHALNINAVAHNVAKNKGKKVTELNLLIAHLGGGISVVPLKRGKMIDANNASEMGPFSPERTGGLPVRQLVKMCFSGDYTYPEVKKKIRGKGGLMAYLGTNDARKAVEMIENGDKKADLIFQAMGYQIAKEIGGMSVALEGDIDAIILTGGMAYSEMLIDYIKDMVGFIAPVIIQPGENEMRALNEGVLRVISGEEVAKIYENEV